MVHSQISQFIHTFFIRDILGKSVMDALFSDSSSWQTTFPGICNVTVPESDTVFILYMKQVSRTALGCTVMTS